MSIPTLDAQARPATDDARTADRGVADHGAATPEELAGSLRTEVNRLAYHLRTPATAAGLTPTRLAALSALARHPEGCRAGDLATEMGVTAASMTRLIDIMVESGWAGRQRDEEDARAVVLTITGAGTDLLLGLRHESTSRLVVDLADLSADDRAALARAVPVLRAIADRHLAH